MASKTISLEEGAYNLLLQAKRGEESFSQVVRRILLPRDDPVRKMIGLLTPAQGRAMRSLLDEQRQADRKTALDRYKRLGLT